MIAFGALFTRDGVASHTMRLRKTRAEAVDDAVRVLESEGQAAADTGRLVASAVAHCGWTRDGHQWAVQIVLVDDKRSAVVGVAASKKDEQPDLSGSSQAILERNGLDG